MAVSALQSIPSAMTDVIMITGLLTDELTDFRGDVIDHRTASGNEDFISRTYLKLQTARNNAQLARATVRAYPPTDTTILAHLYAMEGYADVLLADLFCSGIPLSTIDFQRDFTYRAGSSTTDVYQRAVALFDSATLVPDTSSSFAALIHVGKARALLQLGQFSAAAQAAASVPTQAQYQIRAVLTTTSSGQGLFAPLMSMANRDGGNGLPFVQAKDPRVLPESTTVYWPGVPNPYTIFYPVQDVDAVNATTIESDSLTTILVSGVEARLIEAEAALHANPSGSEWLNILNALRTSGSFTVTTRQNIPGSSPGPAGYPDTTWAAGTGAWLIPASVQADNTPVCEQADPNSGVTPPCTDVTWYRGLAPLADPGASLAGQAAADARIDLLFRERAFWLFLTGHREGDMRRLVRATTAGGYGRAPDRVYPTGVYRDGTPFGSKVVFPIPDAERSNPEFAGCLSLGA